MELIPTTRCRKPSQSEFEIELKRESVAYFRYNSQSSTHSKLFPEKITTKASKELISLFFTLKRVTYLERAHKKPYLLEYGKIDKANASRKLSERYNQLIKRSMITNPAKTVTPLRMDGTSAGMQYGMQVPKKLPYLPGLPGLNVSQMVKNEGGKPLKPAKQAKNKKLSSKTPDASDKSMSSNQGKRKAVQLNKNSRTLKKVKNERSNMNPEFGAKVSMAIQSPNGSGYVSRHMGRLPQGVNDPLDPRISRQALDMTNQFQNLDQIPGQMQTPDAYRINTSIVQNDKQELPRDFRLMNMRAMQTARGHQSVTSEQRTGHQSIQSANKGRQSPRDLNGNPVKIRGSEHTSEMGYGALPRNNALYPAGNPSFPEGVEYPSGSEGHSFQHQRQMAAVTMKGQADLGNMSLPSGHNVLDRKTEAGSAVLGRDSSHAGGNTSPFLRNPTSYTNPHSAGKLVNASRAASLTTERNTSVGGFDFDRQLPIPKNASNPSQRSNSLTHDDRDLSYTDSSFNPQQYRGAMAGLSSGGLTPSIYHQMSSSSMRQPSDLQSNPLDQVGNKPSYNLSSHHLGQEPPLVEQMMRQQQHFRENMKGLQDSTSTIDRTQFQPHHSVHQSASANTMNPMMYNQMNPLSREQMNEHLQKQSNLQNSSSHQGAKGTSKKQKQKQQRQASQMLNREEKQNQQTHIQQKKHQKQQNHQGQRQHGQQHQKLHQQQVQHHRGQQHMQEHHLQQQRLQHHHIHLQQQHNPQQFQPRLQDQIPQQRSTTVSTHNQQQQQSQSGNQHQLDPQQLRRQQIQHRHSQQAHSRMHSQPLQEQQASRRQLQQSPRFGITPQMGNQDMMQPPVSHQSVRLHRHARPSSQGDNIHASEHQSFQQHLMQQTPLQQLQLQQMKSRLQSSQLSVPSMQASFHQRGPEGMSSSYATFQGDAVLPKSSATPHAQSTPSGIGGPSMYLQQDNRKQQANSAMSRELSIGQIEHMNDISKIGNDGFDMQGHSSFDAISHDGPRGNQIPTSVTDMWASNPQAMSGSHDLHQSWEHLQSAHQRPSGQRERGTPQTSGIETFPGYGQRDSHSSKLYRIPRNSRDRDQKNSNESDLMTSFLMESLTPRGGSDGIGPTPSTSHITSSKDSNQQPNSRAFEHVFNDFNPSNGGDISSHQMTESSNLIMDGREDSVPEDGGWLSQNMPYGSDTTASNYMSYENSGLSHYGLQNVDKQGLPAPDHPEENPNASK